MGMQSNAWGHLLRQIPAESYQSLSLVTTGGTEIALQGILRIEREFVAIRGRLAGSQHAGRLYFIPYTHIDYLGTQVEVKDAEFEAMFGQVQLSGAAAAAAPASEPPAAPPAAPSQLPSVSQNTPVPGSGSAVIPIRSAVLERFRARNNSASGTLPRPSANGPKPGTSQLPG
jgi:hypothetical protein